MSILFQHPVIFLAFASAWNAGQLPNVPVEARALRAILEPLAEAGRIELILRQDVTTDEVFDLFQDERYAGRVAIFHYAGHADQYGLLLTDKAGAPQKTDASGFAAFLAEQPGLRMVFLNGCATAAQVYDLLGAGVPAIVATRIDIVDELAAEFASRFYKGLAGGADIATAYRSAAAAARTVQGSAQALPWALHLHAEQPDAGAWQIPEPPPTGPEGKEQSTKSPLNQQIGSVDLRHSQGAIIGSTGPITQSFGPMSNNWEAEAKSD